MLRYIESWWRLRWLWWIEIGLWLIATTLFLSNYLPEHESVTRVWVAPEATRLLFADQLWKSGTLRNAALQTQALEELVRTDAFVTRVANNTALTSIMTTPEGRRQVRGYLASNLRISLIGDNLFELRFIADPPELANQLMRATVGALRDIVAEADRSQAELLISSHQVQLAESERSWQAAAQAVQDFIRKNPDLSDAPTLSALSPIRLELQELRLREENAYQTYQQLRATIDGIQQTAAARSTGWRASTSLIDVPAVDQRPRPAWRSLAPRIIAVTLMLFTAGMITLMFATWFDSSFNRPVELQRRFNLPILGTVPRRRLRRRWPLLTA